jgi:titin
MKPYFDPPLQPEFRLNATETMSLDCKVEPKEDPHLRVEWLMNGKPLEVGTRFKTTFDFGFVNLTLEDVQTERDSGVYTCHAWNKHGECFTTCTVYIEDKSKLVITDTQHPKGVEGLDKIQQIEANRAEGKKPKDKPEGTGMPPKFTTPVGEPFFCSNISSLLVVIHKLDTLCLV